MTLTIETAFKKNNKIAETFTVLLDIDKVTKIAKSKGIKAANDALDKFVSKFTSDFKKRLSSNINH